MRPTLYDVLEINRSASPEAIVGAYKHLHALLSARIDGIEGADRDTLDRMTALREAFNTLSDPERRQRYDIRLAAGRNEGFAILKEPPPLFLKPLLFVALIGFFGAGYVKLQSEQEKARQEWEHIVAEARMADLQLQREREEKRMAARADFERRRDEAMTRFNRQQPWGSVQSLESRPPNKIRS